MNFVHAVMSLLRGSLSRCVQNVSMILIKVVGRNQDEVLGILTQFEERLCAYTLIFNHTYSLIVELFSL